MKGVVALPSSLRAISQSDTLRYLGRRTYVPRQHGSSNSEEQEEIGGTVTFSCKVLVFCHHGKAFWCGNYAESVLDNREVEGEFHRFQLHGLASLGSGEDEKCSAGVALTTYMWPIFPAIAAHC